MAHKFERVFLFVLGQCYGLAEFVTKCLVLPKSLAEVLQFKTGDFQVVRNGEEFEVLRGRGLRRPLGNDFLKNLSIP